MNNSFTYICLKKKREENTQGAACKHTALRHVFRMHICVLSPSSVAEQGCREWQQVHFNGRPNTKGEDGSKIAGKRNRVESKKRYDVSVVALVDKALFSKPRSKSSV